MWSTIAGLKDNFAKIANDVLDTADEFEDEEGLSREHGESEKQQDGAADLEAHDEVDLNERTTSDVEAELRWYKAEVQRLSANDSDIQALSTNYSNLLRERELDIQHLQEENQKLVLEVQKLREEHVSQEDSKGFQEKIRALGDDLQRAADAHQEELAALQNHQQQQTSILVSKHKEELEKARGEVAESRKQHESNGFLSTDDLKKQAQEALERAQTVEKALQQLQEKEKDLSKLVTEKEGENNQLQASFEQTRTELAKLRGLLADHEAKQKELQQQLGKKSNESADVSSKLRSLQDERDQLLNEVQERRAEKKEAENAVGVLREQLQEALSQRERVDSQLKAERSELRSTLTSKEKEVEDLQRQVKKAEQEPSASGRADEQKYQQELAEARAGHERLVAELKKSIVELEERLRTLSEQKERESTAEDAVANEEELAKTREEVASLQERLRSSEEASTRQAQEHGRELGRVLEERDKARRDLARLKQHLLEKAEEESEKMSEDSARIASLEARCSELEVRRKELEESLRVTSSELAKERAASSQDVQATSEEVARLKEELEEALASVSSKDMELVNLNSALGQYYAETEAKERLQGELHHSREEVARLTKELEASQKVVAAKEAEKQGVADKIAAAESRVVAAEKAKFKLQEEVDRLRKALEQSMTRIHRMSSDSDQYVDRRIVIKLLVTYFEKRHSAEVLDLMARILGFSEEDKKRVGLAKDNSERRGVVSGVLGAPSRIVGAVFGGASAPPSPRTSVGDKDPSSATFTDLWIDFLLREAQQQEEQRRNDERAAEEKKALAALSESEAFALPRARSSLSPQSSISGTSLPGMYNPTQNSVYANQISSPTGGPLPGVYYASTLFPRPANGPTDSVDKRRSGSLDSDGLALLSPKASGNSGSGEFSSVPLNSSTGQR